MTEQLAEGSPRAKARFAGAFYLLTILTGALALFVTGPSRSVVLSGATVCYVVVTLLLYGLFRPVSRYVSAVAALVSLAGCALPVLSSFHLVSSSLNPLVLFGCYCLLIGYLVLRSRFLPRILGVLMGLGGLGWLTFAVPALANSLSPYNMAPGILGESAFAVWLLAVGVDVQRWKEQAHPAA